MKKLVAPIFLASMTAASAASAEGLNYLSYGASYTNLTADTSYDESAGFFGADISTDYQNGNFVFNGGVNVLRVSGGDVDSLTLSSIDARLGYLATPSLAVHAGLDYDVSSETDSFTAYNLGIEYSVNALTFGIMYDDSGEDNYQSTTTVYGSYRVSEAFEAILTISDTDGRTSTTLGVDFDNGRYDVAALFNEVEGVSTFALDGSYAFGNGFRVSGNYVNFDGEELDMISVGAGYEVSEDLWVDFNIGRIGASSGADRSDTIGLALTYEMGRETLLIDRTLRVSADAFGIFAEFVRPFQSQSQSPVFQ